MSNLPGPGRRMTRRALPALVAGAILASGASPPTDTAVLAGGCFWGVEAVFEHVKGVREVVSGYAGGRAADASYAAVSTGRTGHAEAVRITFDPTQVSYGQLLAIHASVAHDPTQVNRQGPDVGPSYRSAIFPQSAAQERAAEAFLARLRASKAFGRPIATRIEKGRFFAAEAGHQDFVRRNPWHPYVLVHDRPKLAALRRAYPHMWRG